MPTRSVLALLALLLAATGCDSAAPDPPEPDSDPTAPPSFVTRLDVTVDPQGASPLSAEVALETDVPVSVEVQVEGKGGPATAIRHRFEDVSLDHRVPIFGLYPTEPTAVTLVFFDADGAEIGRVERSVEAGPVPSGLPVVTIQTANVDAIRPGLTFVSSFSHGGETTPQTAFAFDPVGAIRWVLDFRGQTPLTNLFYDNGIDRLANGNLVFGDGATDRIYEVDLFGRIVNQWALLGFGFHHHVVEKPDGNLLVTVDRNGASTVEDVVIELDRATGRVVREWDLRRSLDRFRQAWPTDLADLTVDWFHANAIAYDETDDAILVSGRTQGLVKLSAANEVVWILSPHRGWGRAGDGTDLSTKLLQPLDAAGQPIRDAAVLDGTAVHPDFEWAWYQHAPEILPDGSILLFDNGDNRGYAHPGTYSRAVIFDIDEAAMTVRQVWAYGKERGEETYSRIVSDVDYHAAEDHVVFAPGAVARESASPYGKVVEVDRATGAVLFEATIRPPQTLFGITFHRVERMPMVPAGLRSVRPEL